MTLISIIVTGMDLPVQRGSISSDQAFTLLVDRFARSRKSLHTAIGYRRDLHNWADWCADNRTHPLRARHAEVLDWLAALRANGDSEATLARRLSALSSWYRWLQRERPEVVNPTTLRPEERPHADPKSNTLALSTSQAERLLAAADRDSPRSAAVVSILVYTGVRVGELVALDVKDLTEQSGQPVLSVMGKGRRERMAPLPPQAYDRTQAYLRSRATDDELLPAVRAQAGGSRPLIATSGGGRIARGQIRRDLKRLALRSGPDVAGLIDRLSPHALRHSFATDLLNEGVPLRDVQYAMGHQKPETTERYDHGDLGLARHPVYKRAAQVRAGRPAGHE